MNTLNKHINLSFLILALVFTLSAVHLTGCASDSYAAKGAAEGGTTGAVAGAVGGLVSSLVFGGDPMEGAARGAVYGGATGATVGAIAGSKADEKVEQQNEAQYAKLRQDIGEEAFGGLQALADCQHDVSLSQAANAQKSENPNYALAGLWLEVLSYADKQDESKARTLFPKLVEKDWNIKTSSEAEASMRKALNSLMDIREEYKMPRVCSG